MRQKLSSLLISVCVFGSMALPTVEVMAREFQGGRPGMNRPVGGGAGMQRPMHRPGGNVVQQQRMKRAYVAGAIQQERRSRHNDWRHDRWREDNDDNGSDMLIGVAVGAIGAMAVGAMINNANN